MPEYELPIKLSLVLELFYLQVTFIELIDLVFALSEMPEFFMSILLKFQSVWVFNSLLSLVLCVSFFVLAFFFRRVFGSS